MWRPPSEKIGLEKSRKRKQKSLNGKIGDRLIEEKCKHSQEKKKLQKDLRTLGENSSGVSLPEFQRFSKV